VNIVVDASVLVAALVDGGPKGAWAEKIIESSTLYGPELVRVETTNILRRLERAKEISTPDVGGCVDPRDFGGGVRVHSAGPVAPVAGARGAKCRVVSERWVGGLRVRRQGFGLVPVRMSQKLSGVVTLEGLGELVEELEEGGGGLIGEIHRQTHYRQVIGLHGGALFR
jgi:hypothetical protein